MACLIITLVKGMTDQPACSAASEYLNITCAQLPLGLQKDLYTIMVELAAVPGEEGKFQRLEAPRLSWIEEQVKSFGDRVNMPKDFILPGDSLPAAALDLARTVVRRAERQVVRLDHESKLSNPTLLPYLNRLSSLCFVLSLWENEAAGVEKPTITKSRE
jgi:cob(I)alamin adenosyltransferase